MVDFGRPLSVGSAPATALRRRGPAAINKRYRCVKCWGRVGERESRGQTKCEAVNAGRGDMALLPRWNDRKERRGRLSVLTWAGATEEEPAKQNENEDRQAHLHELQKSGACCPKLAGLAPCAAFSSSVLRREESHVIEWAEDAHCVAKRCGSANKTGGDKRTCSFIRVRAF